MSSVSPNLCHCGCGKYANYTNHYGVSLSWSTYPILKNNIKRPKAMRPTTGHELNVPYVLGEDAPPRSEGKTVAEIEGWRMTEPDPGVIVPWFLGECTLLSHQCPKTKWRQWVEPSDILDKGRCGACKEDIPDGVLAVWHLYNSDNIMTYTKALDNTPMAEHDDYVYVWPDSSELTCEPGETELYGANGELLEEEEMEEWNGTPDEQLLVNHAGQVLQGELWDSIIETSDG